jgi:septal ring factor EnvC (AmiA/AmiB activator)
LPTTLIIAKGERVTPAKLLARRPLALMLLLAGASVPVALLAQSAGTTLAEEQQALAQAKAQGEDARRRSESFEARAARASQEADRARDRAAALAARIQQAEADLRAGQARIAIIARMQRAQAQRLAARQGPVVRLTAALQQIARRAPAMALIQPGSITDAVHRRIVLTRMLPQVMEHTKGLRGEIARSAALHQQADAAAQGMARSRDQLLKQRAELAALEQSRRVASQGLRQNADLEAERALAMSEKTRDIGDLMGKLRDASSVMDMLAALPGPTLRPNDPARTGLPAVTDVALSQSDRAPAYRLPVVGTVITGFGELTGSGIRARGLTIATSPDATVISPAVGRIAFAGPFKGYGQIVIVDHGGGWTTLITDMARLTASVGDQVRQGDPIGVAGKGKPRITIELRRQDRPIDIGALL